MKNKISLEKTKQASPLLADATLQFGQFLTKRMADIHRYFGLDTGNKKQRINPVETGLKGVFQRKSKAELGIEHSYSVPTLRIDEGLHEDNGSLITHIWSAYCRVQVCGYEHSYWDNKTIHIVIADSDNTDDAQFTAQDIVVDSPNEALIAQIVANYANGIRATAARHSLQIQTNLDKFEHLEELARAMFTEPLLTPEKFFEGYQRQTKQNNAYVPLKIGVPDLGDAKETYETDFQTLQNPSGSEFISFGTDASTQASQAASVINDWQNENQYRSPETFRLWKLLNQKTEDIRAANRDEDMTPEKLAQHYSGLQRVLKQIQTQIPKDMETTLSFISDTEKASHALKIHAHITEMYKTGFVASINHLQGIGVHSEMELKRFQGDTIAAKATTLRQSALVRAQKSAEMDTSVIPTQNMVYMALSQMQVDIDQIEETLQKSARTSIMERMKAQMGNKEFNIAASGFGIKQGQFDQFISMDDEARSGLAQKDMDSLTNKIGKWTTSIEGAENAILAIENQTAVPLRITYNPAEEQGSSDPESETGVVALSAVPIALAPQ
jgi:hypothetical protein